MEDHDQGRSGLKEQTKSLSLNRKSREVSLEQQTSMQESQVAELHSFKTTTKGKPTDSPPDVSLDSALPSILRKKVYVLVDTKNALSQSHRMIKHLEEQLQQKTTVPKGLKIKLLDVTLESLCKEVLETEHSVDHCKEDIKATIDH